MIFFLPLHFHLEQIISIVYQKFIFHILVILPKLPDVLLFPKLIHLLCINLQVALINYFILKSFYYSQNYSSIYKIKI